MRSCTGSPSLIIVSFYQRKPLWHADANRVFMICLKPASSFKYGIQRP